MVGAVSPHWSVPRKRRTMDPPLGRRSLADGDWAQSLLAPPFYLSLPSAGGRGRPFIPRRYGAEGTQKALSRAPRHLYENPPLPANKSLAPPIRVQSEEQQIDGVLSVYTIAAIVLLPTVGFVC